MPTSPTQRFIEAAARDLELTKERMRERWQRHANRRSSLIVLVLTVVCGIAYYQYIRPPEQFPENMLITVEEGMPLSAVAQALQENNTVRSAEALRVAVVLLGGEKKVHAGDYLFKEPKNLIAVAHALIVGAYGLEPIRIRIPEGATVAQMARMFGTQLERFNKERFLTEAGPHEGYLFPDTYFFLPNATDETVMKTMRSNFDMQMASIAEKVVASGRSEEEIVIMASILEREAYNTKDRRMIAGVLWNRIKKGMNLQVDATFVYTLGKGSFDLTMKDLRHDEPYNTYVNPGLPPGAIGNPSLDSLLAAADPIPNQYLFYLADSRGVTHYAKTYAEHLRNKAKYIGT